MGAKRDDELRVAELEAEVIRLRERLGEAPAEPATAEPNAAEPAGGEQPLGKFSRGKVIGLAVAITLITLTAFAVLFVTLSSGFDSLARKAAKTLMPSTGTSEGGGSSAAPPSRPVGPAAPGL